MKDKRKMNAAEFARRRRFMTIADVALRGGVGVATVHAVEKGRKVRRRTAKKIAEVLKITMTEVLDCHGEV